MSLSAIECIRRGAANARANWELVLAHWVGMIATTVLTVAGILPFVLVIGFAGFSGIAAARDAQQVEQWLQEWATRAISELVTFSAPMLLALVAALALGALALIVYCFFQAGLYGILVAGDRQSPAGPVTAGSATGDWRLFRTWSGNNFRGWGAHHVWRFFWFFNLVLVLGTLGLAAFLVFVGLIAMGAQSWGAGTAFAVGCGSIVPMLLVLLFFGLWTLVSQADLASADSSVGVASRRALRIVGRRFGGLLVIVGLGIVASLALAMAFMPFSLAVSLVTRDGWISGLVLRTLLAVVQGGLGGVIQVGVAASLVALVRSELREMAV